MERAPKGNIFVHYCFKEMLLLLLTSSKSNALHIIVYSNNAEKNLYLKLAKLPTHQIGWGKGLRPKTIFQQ